jgi:hypothetical protein
MMPLFADFFALTWREYAVLGVIAVLLFGRVFWRMFRR